MSRLGWFFLLVAVASQSKLTTRFAVELPRPSGSYGVGRVSYDWVDSSRPETLSKTPNAQRELVVDVWYPAAQPEPGTKPAAYFPYADKIDQSPYATAER